MKTETMSASTPIVRPNMEKSFFPFEDPAQRTWTACGGSPDPLVMMKILTGAETRLHAPRHNELQATGH